MGGRRIGGDQASHLSQGLKATLPRLCREAHSCGASSRRGAAASPQSEQEAWQSGRKNPFAPLKYLLFQAACQDITILANRSSINIQTYINIFGSTVIKSLWGSPKQLTFPVELWARCSAPAVIMGEI